MQEENSNKIFHAYKAMVVLHICNRTSGIPSPWKRKSNLDAYQILSSIYRACRNVKRIKWGGGGGGLDELLPQIVE